MNINTINKMNEIDKEKGRKLVSWVSEDFLPIYFKLNDVEYNKAVY